MAIRHYLTFVNPEFGRLEIGEPDGFDKNGFVIKQRSDGYGRDISYAGGKSGFRIWAKSQDEYHFDKVLAVWMLHGYNGIIIYEIDFDETTEVIGQLDLADTFKTDSITYIDFNVIENTTTDLFKKRLDTNVNLLATETLDGNPIAPVQTYKMLYKAVPAIKVSEWVNPTVGRVMINDNPLTSPDVFNVIKQPTKFNIQNSLSWLEDYNAGSAEDFIYIDAKTELNDIEITFDLDMLYQYRPQENNSLTNGKNANLSLRLRYGNNYNDSTLVTIWQGATLSGTSNQDMEVPENLTFTIPHLENTDKIWIFFRSVQGNGAVTHTIFNECKVEIKASSVAYSSVIDVVRLIDAMRYTALSVGGNPILAPRWDAGGEFYNQFITTANMMRGLLSKPFNISNKFISDKYLPEVNGDYELQKDGKVFYGIYRDFYRNVECGVFDMGAFEFALTTNPLYACNELSAKFENFQSQRETEKDNTNDIAHGEAAWLYPNKGAQNKKEISIGVVRDPFLTDEVRIKGYIVSDNAATNDDSKIFAIDGLLLQQSEKISTTTFLQHSVIDGKLVLANQGEISWERLGIVPGSTFYIYSSSPNGDRFFEVESVSGNTLTLIPPSGYSPVGNEGASTRYEYEAKADYVNRTTEGFTIIDNLTNSGDFGNLLWTIKRVLIDWYSEFNASNLIYADGQLIKNTLYNNNPDLVTQYGAGEIIREGDSFTAKGAILSTQLVNCTIVSSFKQWMSAQEKIRSQRGFIRIIQPNGLPLKVYLKDGEFLSETAAIYPDSNYFGSAKIIAEVKNEPMQMSIIGVRGEITINDEITPSGYTFKIDGIGKLSIFDATGRLLHIPVLYNNVAVNGVVANSKQQLGEWMTQLTPEWDGL